MRKIPFNLILRGLAFLAFGLFLFRPAWAATSNTFTNPIFIPTVEDVVVLTTADLNHDGNPDLVYVDGNFFDLSHVVHVLLGNGDGTFRHGQDIDLPAGRCCALAIADVTNDGIPDLIVASSNGFPISIAVLAGNGDGTFQQPLVTTFQPINITGFPELKFPAVVGDINGDGKMDLVLPDISNNALYTLLGDNSGKFKNNGTIHASATGPAYLVDLTGSHILDLIATDPIGAGFAVYRGKGDGTFPSFTSYSLQTSAGPFLLVDVNRDGHPDILVDYNPSQLGYFPGKPDGTFGTFIPLGNSPSSNQLVSAGDLNGDGIPDLTFITPSGIAVALGQTGPAFGPPLTTITGGSTSPYSTLPIIPAVADFNGDGHLDLAMAAEGGIAIFLGKGNGTFASTEFYDMGQEVGSAAVADFSGHGFQDIAVTLPAPFPRLLLGNGTGTFTLGPDPNTSYASSGALVTLLPADFNGDGKPDLNIGNGPPNESFSGTDSVAINAGNGAFQTPLSVPNTSPIMGDFNGDGRTDLINVSGTQITVSLGQANGLFHVVTTALRVPFNDGHFNVGDVNRDGKPDLILNYFDHLEVWLGNGDGTFTYSNSIELTNVVSDFVAVVADLDGDGNGDVILAPDANVAAALGPLAIFFGSGDGTFQPPIFVPVSHRYSWITVADLNADGKPDLVMTDGASIAVMMNLGGRKFDAETDYIAGRSVSIPISVVDVNGDGLPDIVVGNTGGTTVTVLLNQTKGSSPGGAPVSANLAINPEPSNYLNPFSAMLSLSGQSAGPVPAGTVSFSADDIFVTTVSLSNGAATWTEAAKTLVPGQHSITAGYSGDSTYAPRIVSVIHTIQPPVYPTQTGLSGNPTSVLAGQTIRFIATVSGAPPPPAGAVTFFDGASSIGSNTIDALGRAYHDTSLLGIGTHTITASFQGFTQTAFTTNNMPFIAAIFSPSTSGPLTVVVNSDATTITLSPSNTSPVAGSVVTFTAIVSSLAGVPFGGATFYDGNAILGTLGLTANGNVAFSTASLSTGAHTITASFNANGPFAGSTSAPVSINVTAPPANAVRSVISLLQKLDPATSNSILVASVNAQTRAPSGTVTFLDNGSIFGTAETDATGAASLDVGVLASGTHSLTASFGGNAAFSPTVSPELYAQWPQTGPGFSLNLSGGGFRVRTSEPIFITIEGMTDFDQQVQLSCASGLPRAYSCDFSPAVVTGRGVSTLTIVPQRNAGSPLIGRILFGAFVIGIGLVILPAGRSRALQLAVRLSICCILSVVSACSVASPQTEQAAVVTIRATSGTGANAIVHSAQIQVFLTSK
jgi:hypothetical protein